MLLQKKPQNLKDTVECAATVEYALNFEGTEVRLASELINLLYNKDNKHKDHQLQEEYVKLHKTVEDLTKQVKSLETAVWKSREMPPMSFKDQHQWWTVAGPKPIDPPTCTKG